MTENRTKNSKLTILLVEPSSQQIAQLKRDIPDWNWIEMPPPQHDTGVFISGQSQVDVVIVFAKSNEEEYALTLCEKIRKLPELNSIPLLVAINRYQMMLGNDVKHLPLSHFIFAPIDKNSLIEKLEEINTSQR